MMGNDVLSIYGRELAVVRGVRPATVLAYPFSYASAYRYVVDAGAAVGLDISPHSMRHLYACLMYFRNLDGESHDPVWVRDAMCHASIGMTDRYMKLARYVVLNDFDWHEIVWHWVPDTTTSEGAAS